MNLINKLYAPIKDKPLRGLVFFIWFVWLGLQICFLGADGDASLTQNDFITEGLYSFQIRNYINHGFFRLEEGDYFIKAPLLSGYLFAPFYFFGTKLIVGRIAVLTGFSLVILWLGLQVEFAHTALFLIIFGLFQYHLFQYSHFCIPEPLCVACTLIAFFHLIRFANNIKIRSLIWAAFWLIISTLLKVQFINLLGLLPFAILLALFYNKDFRDFATKKRPIIGILVILFCCITLFWWGFYDPFKSGILTASKYNQETPLLELKNLWWLNFRTFFLNKYTLPLTLLFIICFKSGIFILVKERNRLFSLGFWIICAWIVLEMQRLGMSNLSSKKLISCWIAMTLLSSWVLAFGIHLLLNIQLSGMYKLAIWTLLLPMTFMLLSNRARITHLWEKRSYSIQLFNEYLNNSLQKGEVVLGAMSPHLCWNKKAYAVTVGKGYVNDEIALGHYLPRAVISELDETGMDKSFSPQGVDLLSLSDSTYYFTTNGHFLRVYWLKKDTSK